MHDILMLSIAVLFAMSAWLLLWLSDRLMGDKK
jgi:hypothetical protein